MKSDGRYAMEVTIRDTHTGSSVFHFRPGRGNIGIGLITTRKFVEEKLGITVIDRKAVEEKINTVLRLR